MPDNNLDDALQSLAGHAARTGRLDDATVIRHRGDVRRRRQQATMGALSLALAGLAVAGIAVTGPDPAPHTGTPSGLTAPPRPSSGAPATPTASSNRSPSVPPSSLPPQSPSRSRSPNASSAKPSTGTSSAAGEMLFVQRQVSIVRVQATEAGVALTDDGRVAEVDGNSGRRIFVLVPATGGTYLIRTTAKGADGQTACWQTTANGSDPITVTGATCSTSDPRQRFTITARRQNGRTTYAIANDSAFLQNSARLGLILEELGDAPLTTTFHIIDNGPEPTSG